MDNSLIFNYSPAFFERFCPVLEEVIPSFDRRYFVFRVFNNDWPEMRPAERTTHLAKVLRDFLPADFNRATTRIRAMAEALHSIDEYHEAAQYPFLFKYIELFGTDHMVESLNCLRYIAKVSGEPNGRQQLYEETRA